MKTWFLMFTLVQSNPSAPAWHPMVVRMDNQAQCEAAGEAMKTFLYPSADFHYECKAL